MFDRRRAIPYPLCGFFYFLDKDHIVTHGYAGSVLIVNQKIEGVSITEIVKSSELFFSLVYPSVLREILIRILVIDDAFEDDEPVKFMAESVACICRKSAGMVLKITEYT